MVAEDDTGWYLDQTWAGQDVYRRDFGTGIRASIVQWLPSQNRWNWELETTDLRHLLDHGNEPTLEHAQIRVLQSYFVLQDPVIRPKRGTQSQLKIQSYRRPK